MRTLALARLALADLYTAAIGQSMVVDELIAKLRTRLRQEVTFQNSLQSLLGTMDVLFAAAAAATSGTQAGVRDAALADIEDDVAFLRATRPGAALDSVEVDGTDAVDVDEPMVLDSGLHDGAAHGREDKDATGEEEEDDDDDDEDDEDEDDVDLVAGSDGESDLDVAAAFGLSDDDNGGDGREEWSADLAASGRGRRLSAAAAAAAGGSDDDDDDDDDDEDGEGDEDGDEDDDGDDADE